MNESELYHYGVLGMKWGVRKERRRAQKDARESARAKMYHGEGAGTRRKLIKATVEQRSSSPVYRKAYEQALAKQDMAKHAKKAKTERKAKDAYNTTTKTGRGLINILNGNRQAASALAVTLASIGFVAHKAGVTDFVADKGRNLYSDLKKDRRADEIKKDWDKWARENL